MSTQTKEIAAKNPSLQAIEELQELRLRALELLRSEIDFVPSPEFQATDGGIEPLVQKILLNGKASGKAQPDLPSHLYHMCQTKLLTPQEESLLFREMNYLKWRANALRSRLDPDDCDRGSIATIESLLSDAEAIRDHIIKANIRLVLSIVKQFVRPRHSFDDLLSDGIHTLMRAVSNFDYGRGYRFSTYAYRAIVRNVYRTVTLVSKHDGQVSVTSEEWLFDSPSTVHTSMAHDRALNSLREQMATMITALDRREQFIVRSRYALGAHRKVRTFQYLADKLGVSKERVRQLESRAVGKLRKLAANTDLADNLTIEIQ